ncbi:hypothetical protein HY498_00075 [Candidatus Woesearchaeota archaeon]|nr:hypothetical protein [Candidatus Woesearchaeota archaeon]
MESERGVERYLFIGFIIISLASILVGSGSYSGGVIAPTMEIDYCNCEGAKLYCDQRLESQSTRDAFQYACGSDPCIYLQNNCGGIQPTQQPSPIAGPEAQEEAFIAKWVVTNNCGTPSTGCLGSCSRALVDIGTGKTITTEKGTCSFTCQCGSFSLFG